MKLLVTCILVSGLVISGAKAWSWDLGQNIATDQIRAENIAINANSGASSELHISEPIILVGASSIRVRLFLGQTDPVWDYVYIYNKNGVLKEVVPSISIEDGVTHIWSNSISGDTVFIGIEVPAETSVNIAVDGVHSASSGWEPNAIVGTPSFESLDALEGDPVQPFSDLLAAILIDPNEKELAGKEPIEADLCSGLLISPDLLLTAAHCIQYKTDSCQGVTAIFGYTHEVSIEPSIRVCEEVVYLGHSIDVALLRLGGEPSDGPFPILPISAVEIGTPVRILQHPLGSRARVARDNGCKVGETKVRLWPNTMKADYASTKEAGFKHFCDTKKGSSGAALLSDDGQVLLGVQHAGSDERQYNLAVRGDVIRYCIGYQSFEQIAGPNDDILCK